MPITWFDKAPKYDKDTESYTPRKTGLITALGRISSGISAPFVGDFDYARELQQLQQQQDAQDMEFQKYLLQQKAKQEGELSKDAYELAILSKLFPGIDLSSVAGGIEGPMLSGQQLTPSPVNPPSFGSAPNPNMSGLPTPEMGITDFKVGGISFGQTPQSKAEMEIAKEAAKIPAKQQKEAESLVNSTKLIGNLYNEAFQEIQAKVPGVGKSGAEGIFSRLRGKAGKALGEFPKLKAYEDGIKAFATDYAKGAGEARPTDEDIVRFLDTLPVITNLTSTSETNKAKIRNQLLKLQSKGVSYKWAEDVASELGVDLDVSIKHKGKNYKIPYQEIGEFKKEMGIK